MNQKLKYFNLKIYYWYGAGLTTLLILTGLAVFVFSIKAKTFIVLLNAINAVLFSCFVFFRKNIERIIVNLIHESTNFSVNIKYNYEKEIGFTLIALLIIFCGYIISLALYDVESYSRLIKEDGIIEYCSAIFWFLSAIVVCIHMIELSKKNLPPPPPHISHLYQFRFNIMLIIFFFVCFGEEISWGQRLFGITTPEFIKSINVQNEITLHNMGSISVFSNTFFLLTVVFFLLVPYLMKKNTLLKQVLYFIHFPVTNRFAMYVYMVSLLVWGFIGIRFGTLGFHPFSLFPEQYYVQMDDEIFEFFAAYSFLCFSILDKVKKVTIINLTNETMLRDKNFVTLGFACDR